LLRKRKAV